MDSRIDYELLASDYARHRRIHPGVVRELIEYPRPGPSSSVVEVGSGTGNYLIAVQTATGCEAMGIEPSLAMLDQARGRGSECRWLEGRAESLPLETGSVDLLFSVDVIHHVIDRSAFFRETRRVLASGGLVCTVTDSEEDIRRRRPLSSHFPETIEHELRRYPAIDKLKLEMSRAGFREISEHHVELEYDLSNIDGYRNRAYSSLHLITPEEFRDGIARLERDLATGTMLALSLYTLVWGVANNQG